ncbi:flagellar protein FlaG [Shewanella maritima]|uniref:flagellar protein FlaG n=1 Tax=Shewanella maritima TaxID=2520507 RepID=UPI0037366174
MEINQTQTAQFISQSEHTKKTLNQEPLAADANNGQVSISRSSSIQAVKDIAESEKNKQQKNDDEIEQIADDLTEMVAMMQKGLKFSVDKDSGQQVIKVQDIDSGDVIRQIPSEEALKLAEKLSEVSGILMKIEV